MDTIKIEHANVKMVAHRGVSKIEPENTAASFIAAGNRSYFGIETDIYRTADGRFAVNHDGNLLRVGGVNLCVENETLEELQKVVLFDIDGSKTRADLRVPTLENYIAICKKYNKHCILELKSKFTKSEIETIFDIINGYEYLSCVTFISFILENLLLVREISSEQSAQLLFGAVTDDIIEVLKRNKLDADIHYTDLSKEKVDLLHSLGIKVNCWTVDIPCDAHSLIEMGVDYITTNILE